MHRPLRVALSVAALAFLASCGGGGGTADAPTGFVQPQAAPSKNALGVSSAAPVAAARKTYIVQLSEPAVAAYDGGVAGHSATRLAKGSKLDVAHPDVVRYRGHLVARQDALLKEVGGAHKSRSYTYVFNGFAAELTDAQADKLANTAGVLAVSKDERRKLDTVSTPTFLGLTGRDGFWKDLHSKGENVVIGIVDSGIWPQHPSFSDRERQDENEDLAYAPIRGWNGTCITGEQFTAADCNRKLIGARYYNEGFGGDAGIKATFPYEFNSPRDFGGHGTHTASTAGGNARVPATGAAAVFGKISGIAPRARIAVYKVCWGESADPNAGCQNSDSVQAIDDAVADGVDVINFSISGTSTNFRDPVEIAFLFAADAGVFVAASAGNSGPTASTVAHPSPWLTTVAAGTHNRDSTGSVTLGNGVTYNGPSAGAAVPSAALINSTAAGLPGASATAVARCFAAEDNGGVAVLDPAKVAGKIVVCDRGTNARVNKSLAVSEAGGVGMVLLNVSPNSVNADLHFVPTVHLPDTDRAAVKAYADSAGASAAIAQATITFTAPAPFTAAFSSRGPLKAGGGSLLKPDLMAPGQDILAAVAPVGNHGRLVDSYSGTSMSSPHVAGLAALMKELHPRWSPMAIKSALMTSAGDVLDGPNTAASVIFSQGAGHVRPSSAADPGLVFDSDINDWFGFLCGTQLDPAFCTSRGIPVVEPSNFNGASIAIGSLSGVQTVTRRVTNVGSETATYRASVAGMAGFNVKVTPAALTLARGQTKTFTVTFTRTDAALDAYVGGQLTLTGGTSSKKSAQRAVRVPLVVQPVALAAPRETSASFAVKFGFSGAFSATARGLVPASSAPGQLAAGDALDFTVDVPAGTTYARFSLFDADVGLAGTDLDVEVYDAAGTLVGSSGGATASEEVNLVSPVAGAYTIRVIGYSIPGAIGATANFHLFSWTLGSSAAGNMAVTAPSSASTGGSGSIGLSFSGLTAGTKYLGAVVYSGAVAIPNQTIVRVDP
jgi:Subtilase family/Fibronectin type-III domain/Peptidase inhibitor I9/PA domain